ncbi:MAG TPA: hypothetical protein VJG90_02200 [Candidatus Nanoarchaeia archaeon]|nr:hypothetical protein [Candidatus Nanoarchaeia archaeon]
MAIELEKVVEAVILIMVLVVAAILVYTYATSQKSALSCLDRGGVNVNPDDFQQVQDHPDTDWNCIRGPIFTFFLPEDQKHLMCCIPETPQAKQKSVQEQKEQRERVESGSGSTTGSAKETIKILATLDTSITPLKNGQTITLNAYQTYTLHLQIEGEVKNRYCTIHFVDPNTPNKEEYYFDLETPQEKAVKIVPIKDPSPTFLPCGSLEKTSQEFYIIEEYTSKTLQLQVLVHSDKLIYDETKDAVDIDSLLQQRIRDTPSAELKVNIKTTPSVTVTLQPNTWSTKAEIQLTCKTILCDNLVFGTVYPMQGQDLATWTPQEACDELVKNPPANRFTKIVHNLPLGASPSGLITVPVEISLKPQKQPNGKLGKTFTVDAETLRTDFTRTTLQTYQNEYPCFQVNTLRGESVTKTTEKPLLLDAQPPVLTRELIRVNYQTPSGDLFGSNGKYDPKLTVSSIYLSIPKGACQDVSGCSSYHYSFTPLQDFTLKDDLIGKVMNEIFRTLYAKSVTDADCKPSGSSYTTVQSKVSETTIIPLSQQGLGYVCLYAQDKAQNNGQPILIPYLNPYSSVNGALVS